MCLEVYEERQCMHVERHMFVCMLLNVEDVNVRRSEMDRMRMDIDMTTGSSRKK